MISLGLSLTSFDMSGFVDTEKREREIVIFIFSVDAFRHTALGLGLG